MSVSDADSDNPTLADVMRAAIRVRLADMHVSMPGRVVSYDKANQSASVQPLLKVNQTSEEGTTSETPPVIHAVPVVFQGAGGFSVSFPVAVGDLVLLVFSEQSLDRWLAGAGDITDPVDPRRFALTDAIAIPGLRPFGAALSGEDDNAMIVRVPTGKELRLGSATANDPVARKSDLQALYNAISGAAVATDNSGAAFKANILLALAPLALGYQWPQCSAKIKAD